MRTNKVLQLIVGAAVGLLLAAAAARSDDSAVRQEEVRHVACNAT
jgi:hypothetical protein